ncbi:hypothetical protein AAY473_006871 [Plecturocebus cupreus]
MLSHFREESALGLCRHGDNGVSLCHPDWSAAVISRLTATCASHVAGTTEMGFHHVGQAGVELLTSSDPPTSASQTAGMTAGRSLAPPLPAHGGWSLRKFRPFAAGKNLVPPFPRPGLLNVVQARLEFLT